MSILLYLTLRGLLRALYSLCLDFEDSTPDIDMALLKLEVIV